MNPVVLQTIIATIGVVAGAIITAFVSAYSAHQKIKVIELAYQQKLNEHERLFRQKLDQEHIACADMYFISLLTLV